MTAQMKNQSKKSRRWKAFCILIAAAIHLPAHSVDAQSSTPSAVAKEKERDHRDDKTSESFKANFNTRTVPGLGTVTRAFLKTATAQFSFVTSEGFLMTTKTAGKTIMLKPRVDDGTRITVTVREGFQAPPKPEKAPEQLKAEKAEADSVAAAQTGGESSGEGTKAVFLLLEESLTDTNDEDIEHVTAFMRKVVKSRFPRAKIVEESRMSAGSATGPAFRLEQTTDRGEIWRIEMVFIPYPGGTVEFEFKGVTSAVKRNERAFHALRLSFVSAPIDQKLVVPDLQNRF